MSKVVSDLKQRDVTLRLENHHLFCRMAFLSHLQYHTGRVGGGEQFLMETCRANKNNSKCLK